MKWISVNNCNPKQISSVLGYGNGMIYFLFYNSNGKWCLDNDYIENITHWMPLPEPPCDT